MSQKLHDVLSGLMDDMKATEDTIDTAVTFISNLPHIVAAAVEHALGAAGADDETMTRRWPRKSRTPGPRCRTTCSR